MRTLLTMVCIMLCAMLCANAMAFNFQREEPQVRPDGFIFTYNSEVGTTGTLLAVDDKGTTRTGTSAASQGEKVRVKCATEKGTYQLYLELTDGKTVQLANLGEHKTLDALTDVIPDPDLRRAFVLALRNEGVTVKSIRKAALIALGIIKSERYQTEFVRTRIEREKALYAIEDQYVIE